MKQAKEFKARFVVYACGIAFGLALAVTVGQLGCTPKQATYTDELETTATTSSAFVALYENQAQDLRRILDNGRGMCKTGRLNAGQCDNLKEKYNKARNAFIVQGDALIRLIVVRNDAPGTAAVADAEMEYDAAKRMAAAAIGKVKLLAAELGVYY